MRERKTMVARIKTEIAVGVTDEIQVALENAVAFSGIKASQYARIALVEKLCREQFMQHPGLAHLEKSAPKNPINSENLIAAG
jgi:hypothetical protein